MNTSTIGALRKRSWIVIALLMVAATLIFPDRVLAQSWPKWQQVGVSARRYHAMAYDSHRNVIVLYGGEAADSLVLTDTLEFDVTNSRWTRLSVGGPGPRWLHAMTYDSARKVVVLFGGHNEYNYLNDTWEWNGSQWNLRSTSGPTARYGHAMCYDEARQVSVMYGFGSDTWEWDGTTWSQRATTGPGFRRFGSMVYDDARKVTVLVGGEDGSFQCLNDTWEWDGRSWTQRHVHGPSPRALQSMAYDQIRQRIVMFGGRCYPGPSLSDTWEFDGEKWSTIQPAPAPSCYGGAMVYAAATQMTYNFGGQGRPIVTAPHEIPLDSVIGGDTWSWNGTTWRRVSVSPSSPWFGTSVAMTYDESRNVVVLIDTMNTPASLWEWNGIEWSHQYSGDFSRLRSERIVYDSRRDVIVLFGGERIPTGPIAETWEYHAGQWTLRSTAGPAPRWSHAMAYDKARGVVVMFGGKIGGTTNVNDTWEWDGVTWTQRFPTVSPPAQSQHNMAYDEKHQKTVLNGNFQTWDWDGENWVLRASHPNIGSQENSFYDGFRNQVLRIESNFLTYGWTGSTWLHLADAENEYTGPYATQVVAYDRQRNVGVAFVTGSFRTWEMVYTNLPGDVNLDDVVTVADLLAVISAWGPCPAPPQGGGCLGDIAPVGPPMGDGEVNVLDLLMVIDNMN